MLLLAIRKEEVNGDGSGESGCEPEDAAAARSSRDGYPPGGAAVSRC